MQRIFKKGHFMLHKSIQCLSAIKKKNADFLLDATPRGDCDHDLWFLQWSAQKQIHGVLSPDLPEPWPFSRYYV